MISKEILDQEYQKDLKVIAALVANNSNINKPHQIEHHIYIYTQENITPFLNAAKEAGYDPGEVSEKEGPDYKYWYFDLYKETIPNIENITDSSKFLLNLALKYDAEYDGWGCTIVD